MPLFQDLVGLDMYLQEWKQFCRNTWEKDYGYSQKDRFAKTGESIYTIRNCYETNYIECTPQTKYF